MKLTCLALFGMEDLGRNSRRIVSITVEFPYPNQDRLTNNCKFGVIQQTRNFR